MNRQNQRESAQILQFPPPEARFRLGRTFQAQTKQTSKVFETATFAGSGASYHEAAIAEADRSRKS
jgi:hypothetical protein